MKNDQILTRILITIMLSFFMLLSGCGSEESATPIEAINFPFSLEADLFFNDSGTINEDGKEEPRVLYNATIRVKYLNNSFGTDNPAITNIHLVRGDISNNLNGIYTYIANDKSLLQSNDSNVLLTSITGSIDLGQLSISDLYSNYNLTVTFNDGRGEEHEVYINKPNFKIITKNQYLDYNNGLFDQTITAPAEVRSHAIEYLQDDQEGLAASLSMLLAEHGREFSPEEIRTQMGMETGIKKTMFQAKEFLNNLDDEKITAQAYILKTNQRYIQDRFAPYLPGIAIIEINKKQHYCVIKKFDPSDENDNTDEHIYIAHPALGNISMEFFDLQFQDNLTALLMLHNTDSPIEEPAGDENKLTEADDTILQLTEID